MIVVVLATHCNNGRLTAGRRRVAAMCRVALAAESGRNAHSQDGSRQAAEMCTGRTLGELLTPNSV